MFESVASWHAKELLGSPLWGDDIFFNDFLSSRMDKVALTQEKLSLLDDPQVELHLLRSCLSSKIIHLLRTVPFTILKPFLLQFDHNLRSCLGRIMQCSLFDTSWRQASLPFRLGGLGLHESAFSASPAFLGSCNSVRELASTLLSVDINQLSFPNEEDAATLLSESGISSGHLLFSASQKDLQATLDKNLFDDLFASFGIRDQARLTALSHPSGTPLCTCLSTIDNYGDHLLGCSQGPMRILQHDALVNIIYNALSWGS